MTALETALRQAGVVLFVTDWSWPTSVERPGLRKGVTDPPGVASVGAISSEVVVRCTRDAGGGAEEAAGSAQAGWPSTAPGWQAKERTR